MLQIAVIGDLGNPLDPLVVDQVLQLFEHRVARCLIGNPADDNPITVLLVLFDRAVAAQYHRAAARQITPANAAAAANLPARGKIGSRNDIDQLVDRNVRLIDDSHQRIANLAQVMRRNAGRHADRDPLRPVHQQVRKLAGQHRRLHAPLVIRRYEIDRVELQVVQQQRCDRR